MDLRALAELVMLSLFGLSALTLPVGFSVHVFLAPVLRELFAKPADGSAEVRFLNARLERLEERLEGIEGSIDRLAAVQEFERQLEGPKAG